MKKQVGAGGFVFQYIIEPMEQSHHRTYGIPLAKKPDFWELLDDFDELFTQKRISHWVLWKQKAEETRTCTVIGEDG